MADKFVNNPQDLEDTLNALLSEIHNLSAEVTVLKILTPHLLGLLVRQAEDPHKYFQGIRVSSRENLAEGVTFESGDAEANQKILEKALERHDQIFEEIRRIFGFREETTH